MKYEIGVEIELIRYFKVEAESREEAVEKAKKEAYNSLEPQFSVDYSDELCRLEA